MPYIGQIPAIGENNSFKVLDDITSYTLTFNGSSASLVSVANDTITNNSHRFITGQRVTYNTTGTTITGLTAGTAYFIIKEDQNTIKLATTYANAINNIAINFTALGTGSTHTLNIAFDGVNTKFKATYDNGTKAQITRAAQLTLSVNGVIQQPQDTASPTTGFGIDFDSVIVFSTAPISTDVFWGNLVANNFPTFDIADNTVDSFTGDGTTTSFTLSKEPANNQNLLVTLDGVVQYPSDAFVTRAYSVISNVITFQGAPGNATAIQVRHIGFAGATSSAVTGFYGRTGNVGLNTSDTVSIGAATIGVGGIGTSLLVQGNARITGILTIGTGSITLDGNANTISGVTQSNASNTNVTGIATFLNGPVLIGSGTSTGTASQPLQVTGGAYVSGSVGIGITNPTAKLSLINNANINFAGPIAYYDANSAYSSGADRYIVNGVATRYVMDTGVHRWLYAASGTAGNAISFNEAARIDSSGNLLVGTTSVGGKVTINGNLANSFTGSTNSVTANQGSFINYVTQNIRDSSGSSTNRVTGLYANSIDESGSPAQTMYFARYNGYYGQVNINYDSQIYYHNTQGYHFRAYSQVESKDTWWVKPATATDTITNTRADMYLSGNLGIGTASPAKKLHVQTSFVSGAARGGGFTQVLFESNQATASYWEFQANASSTNDILFSKSGTGGSSYGVVGYDHATDALRFYTNGGERVRIGAGGTVYVGTTNAYPSSTSTTIGIFNGTILCGNTSAITTSTSGGNDTAILCGGDIEIARDGVGGTQRHGRIRGTGGGAYTGGLAFDRYYYNGSSYVYNEVFKIDENGNATVSNGNLVIETSGKGIDFSATANSSGTMTSELLDDYERGTFTPVLINAGSPSYSTNLGEYVKIGSAVFINIVMFWSGATPTANTRVGGLPFAMTDSEVKVKGWGAADNIGGPTYALTTTSLSNTAVYYYPSVSNANGSIRATIQITTL